MPCSCPYSPSAKGLRRQSLTVKEKALETRISRAEFRGIRRGMSRARVDQIVGYDGRSAGAFGARPMRNYDMMAFWRWAMITYSDGRLVNKMWDRDLNPGMNEH